MPKIAPRDKEELVRKMLVKDIALIQEMIGQGGIFDDKFELFDAAVEILDFIEIKKKKKPERQSFKLVMSKKARIAFEQRAAGIGIPFIELIARAIRHLHLHQAEDKQNDSTSSSQDS